ncbi:hypothetical protein [Clostridium sp. B9]|uniref:hypothetical protein n=1 Tax=Clostridium sp. B9 TaxID=3423224 RepID=UPI003D2F1319
MNKYFLITLVLLSVAGVLNAINTILYLKERSFKIYCEHKEREENGVRRNIKRMTEVLDLIETLIQLEKRGESHSRDYIQDRVYRIFFDKEKSDD